MEIQSRSQLGQDIQVLKVFNQKRNGYFLDIGAFDGISYSNTYVLEKDFGWKGICVEPLSDEFNKLSACRSAYCCNKALYKTSGEKVEFIVSDMLSGVKEDIDFHKDVLLTGKTITVETITPTDLLKVANAPQVIDYMSLDTEGSELAILEAFNFEEYTVKYINVEHNNQEPRRSQMRELLQSKGYFWIGAADFDDNYIHHSLFVGTRFLNCEYSEPFTITYVDGKLILESPFAPIHELEFKYNAELGICIYSEFYGGSSITEDKIQFQESRMTLEKDTRDAIVFVGANDMAKISKYISLYKTGLFIEAIPHIAKQLSKKLSGINALYNTDYSVCNVLVSSDSGKEYAFNVFSNNGASSSIYEPNEKEWKWTHVNKHYTLNMSSVRLDELIVKKKWNVPLFDLVLDVQGAELDVLKGMGIFLDNVNVLYTEVSCKEFYKGGVLFEDLNSYLESKGFVLHDMFKENVPDHGDVIYIRSST